VLEQKGWHHIILLSEVMIWFIVNMSTVYVMLT